MEVLEWYVKKAQSSAIHFTLISLSYQVHQAYYNGETVAVKVLLESVLKEWDHQQFKREISTMSSVQSRYVSLVVLDLELMSLFDRFVVKLIAYCTQKPPFAIVMEWVDGGTLTQLLYSSEHDLPWQVRLIIAEEIAEGIQCLHLHEPPVFAKHI